MDNNEKDKLEITAENNEKEIENKKQKPLINYEYFSALDIAIGTILSVEVVEGADKLLKFTVDFGEEKPRQIISGIRIYFPNPEFLVGTQAPFLLNLEPRVIRGLESEGMILAGSNENTLALLSPHLRVPAGTRVG